MPLHMPEAAVAARCDAVGMDDAIQVIPAARLMWELEIDRWLPTTLTSSLSDEDVWRLAPSGNGSVAHREAVIAKPIAE